MKDLALQGDDLLVTGYDLGLVSDGDQVLQSTKIRLRFFKGEWFLDTDAGVPYFSDVLVKGPEARGHVESIFKRAILSTPEIKTLKSFSLDFDAAQRALKVVFSAESIYGSTQAEVSING